MKINNHPVINYSAFANVSFLGNICFTDILNMYFFGFLEKPAKVYRDIL